MAEDDEVSQSDLDCMEDSDEETQRDTGTSTFPRFVCIGGPAVEASTLKSYERYQKRFKVCILHRLPMICTAFLEFSCMSMMRSNSARNAILHVQP